MVSHLLGTQELDKNLEELILEKTEGVPFFIEEFVKSLKELKIIGRKGNKYHLAKDIQEVMIPSTIQDVIMARVDTLPEGAKGVLQTGSVIGRDFSYELIKRVTGISEMELVSHLSALKDSELIYERGILPQSMYIFKHVLTQEVTYETLLLQRRRVLHGLVGEAMEELYQDRVEEQVDLLYHHFSLAENWPKAAHYGRLAAHRAHRLSQFHEAVKMYEQAQACLLRLPEDRSRQETLIDLQLEMIWPLHFVGQQDRVTEICREAETVARSLANPVRLGKVLYEYGLSYFFENQYKQAEEYLLHALEQLQGSGDDALITSVKFPLAATHFSQAQWEKAAALYSEVISSQESENTQTEYFEELPFLPYTICCIHLGYIRALQGRIEEATELVRKGRDPALEQVFNPQSKAWCTLWHSAFSALLVEDHGVSERIEEVLKIAEEADSPILSFLGYSAKGNALMAAEQFEAARTAYEQALGAIEGTTHRRYLEAVYHNLVQVNLALGDWLQAERFHQAGLPLVELNPEREAPRFNFLKGRLLASGSPPNFEQAEVFYEQSIGVDEASGAVVLAAQTRFHLAQMLAQKGEVERSRSLLTEIRGQFQDWNIPVWQQKCEQVRTGVGDLGEVEIKDNVDFKIVIEPTIKKCLDSIFQDGSDNLGEMPKGKDLKR
jgi:tetratricopeptide (TPR) repeat protein